VLDEAAAAQFRENPTLRTNLLHSFRLMLDFYGLRLDEANGAVVPAEHFRERAENWLVPGDHNHLRITRILKCLQTCGLGEYAAAFLKCLLAVAGPRDVTEETLRYWREAGSVPA
jgi:opioid growth factor receptor-like protein